MADQEQPGATDIKWADVSAQLSAGLADFLTKSDIAKTIGTIGIDTLTPLLATLFKLAAPIGTGLARAIAEAEDAVAPELSKIAAAAVSDAFGVDVPASAFARASGRGNRAPAADALGAGVINAIKQSAGQLEPSDAAAKRYLSMVINMALEGWYQGFLFEFMSSLIPQFDIGKIESFADLDDSISQVLGLGRITRSVLRPITDATIVTPLRWQTNTTYRPELLSVSQTAQMVARGTWTRERGVQELARQGWSDERIDALFRSVAKYHSAGDLDLLIRIGEWTEGEAVQHLREQGYGEEIAKREIALLRYRRIADYERSRATVAVTAFVNRELNEAQLRTAVEGNTLHGQELAQLIELAYLRRQLNVRRLSLGQVESMVKSGVASMLDYRRAAEREGYPPDDVILLELQLRWELDKQTDIAAARAEAERIRAEERAARERAALARRAEIEADMIAARRGSLATIERAVIRGIAPLSRYVELLEGKYDADTIAIMSELVEQQRAAYVAQQEQRARVQQRAGAKGISWGDVEQAVLAGVVTIEDYRRRLVADGLGDADVALLVATLDARLRDRREAEEQRARAAARSTTRGIDLGRFEQLVLRGRRSLAEYEQLLAALDFDAGAIAAMRELLELRIDDAARARDERAAAEARLRPRGLSLEVIRRGVLLGVSTPAQYEAFMRQQGFAADAILILMAELRADLDAANAARLAREQADAGGGTRELAITVAARAARLGIISPDAYEERLYAAGFGEADVDIQLQLLFAEIADIQAARARNQAAHAGAGAKGITLAQMERAVKLGVRTSEDYRAELAGAGYTPEAIDTLMYVLFAELAQLDDARRRREAIAIEGSARALSLVDMERAVKAGERTPEDYYQLALQLEYSQADAELLTTLLVIELNAKGGAG